MRKEQETSSMKHILSVIILLVVVSLDVQELGAQEILTLEEAKTITLENNFGIQIAKNNVVVAENQTNKKLNNYAPIVSANGGLNGSLGGSSQKFNNGNEASTSNAFTWGANAAVRADYTFYDKRRDITLEQLKEALTLSNLQLRQTIETNLFQVYNGYYRIAQLSENISALKEAMNISRERLRRSEIQLELGQGNGLNILNAKVDIQRDSVNILNAMMNLENEKRNLNVVMGRNTTTEFTVENDVFQEEGLDLKGLIDGSAAFNTAIQANRQNLAINEMDLKIIDAENRPTLTAGAAYNFNFTDSPSGAFIDVSNSRGLAANVGVNWTIFDGSRKIRKEIAVINLSSQKLQIDELEQQIERDIINAWANYQNALFVIQVEESAVATNRENFIRTEQFFKSGQLTSIDFRQAQLNLLNAQTSLNNARFNAKLTEIQLLQLGGRLMDD